MELGYTEFAYNVCWCYIPAYWRTIRMSQRIHHRRNSIRRWCRNIHIRNWTWNIVKTYGHVSPQKSKKTRFP
jgi:hypothetical protein